MGKDGGGSTTTEVNTKATPWEGVQPYLKSLYSQVSGLGNNPLEAYPGQTWVPMSPMMRQGIESNVGFVNKEFPDMYGAGLGALGDMFGAMNVGANPYVQGMNQSLAEQTSAAGQQQMNTGMMNAQRLLGNQQTAYNDMLGNSIEAFRKGVLPGITNDANMTGYGLGGTRQALAQIGATDEWGNDLQDMMRDVTQSQGQNYQDYLYGMGNMYGDNQRALAQGIAQTNLGAYGTGVGAVGQALGYLPQTAELGLMPGQVYQQAGNIFEGYQQKAIDQAVADWDYAQNEPFNRLANMNAIYSGATPYASSSSVTKAPGPTSNPYATAAAAGLGAYGLFS